MTGIASHGPIRPVRRISLRIIDSPPDQNPGPAPRASACWFCVRTTCVGATRDCWAGAEPYAGVEAACTKTGGSAGALGAAWTDCNLEDRRGRETARAVTTPSAGRTDAAAGCPSAATGPGHPDRVEQRQAHRRVTALTRTNGGRVPDCPAP